MTPHVGFTIIFTAIIAVALHLAGVNLFLILAACVAFFGVRGDV